MRQRPALAHHKMLPGFMTWLTYRIQNEDVERSIHNLLLKRGLTARRTDSKDYRVYRYVILDPYVGTKSYAITSRAHVWHTDIKYDRYGYVSIEDERNTLLEIYDFLKNFDKKAPLHLRDLIDERDRA